MTSFPRRGLYAITDGELIATFSAANGPAKGNGMRIRQTVARAIVGGAVAIQYRDKTSDHARRRQEATALVGLCREYATPLIINDDLKLTLAVGADGVHLGNEDPPLEEARALLGGSAVIGVSCYNSIAMAVDAEKRGASYVAFGSFFRSPSKPHAIPTGLELLHEAGPRLHIPIVAIGGITPSNGASLLAAGADLLAVISGVFGQRDPKAAAQAYARLFA
jgi:thiamine-phosphate pyrophosphorylase